MQPSAPALPDRFQPHRRLGRGGIADVWEATDRRTGQVVALKVLRTTDRSTATRLVREAQLLAAVEHPHVLRVVDWGLAPRPWMASERHRRSLSQQVRSGELPVASVPQVAFDLLDALGHLHARGIVHRDVKPGNVLEADDGHYVLCDLGIATCPEPSATRLTATEQLLGTFLYMSPEQRNDPHRVDARADQYGVASTLWFAVLGRSPPDLSLLYLQPQLLDKLPVELREVVRRGTAYAAADRYPSVSAMAEALRVAMRHSRH